MASLRIWIILSWIALPTVMFGGYSLLRLLNRGDALTPFQVNCFRAGHAHAGVLLPLEVLNTLTLSEHQGKTTLTIRSVPFNATKEERETFEAGLDSMRQGFNGSLDQLADYLAQG
jgi:uncharacterized protein YndB with AHSA1/START domain